MLGPQYVTIPQSGTVSGAFSLRNTALAGVWVPVVTSGQLLVQAAHGHDETAPNSADFLRVMRTDGSTPFAANVVAGSVYLPLTDISGGLAWARFETQNPQTDVRTFVVMSKAR